MLSLIYSLSKYLFLLLILLYVQASFWYSTRKSQRGQRSLALWQLFVIVCFQALGYAVIYDQTGDESMLAFYAVQLIFLIGYQLVFRLLYPDSSRLLLNHVCMLLTIGLIMQTRLDPSKAWTQFLIAALSAAGTLLVPMVMKYWRRIYQLRWVFGMFGIVALGLTFLTAQTEYGARLSVSIGDFSMQLTEIVKISFVFFVAASLHKSTDRKQVAVTSAVAAMHVLVLVACNDLGGALILFLSYVFMLFVATRSRLYFFGGLGIGAAACALAWRLFDHVKVRVSTWLNPWNDITNTGWQIAQSLFAIGSGAWFGVGLYQGMPDSIPVVLKDFIFSAVCEEFGGIFALCLILIYVSCLIQFLWTATSMTETFHKIVCFGLACVMGIQILLNIGGVTKFIPMTGVTLPLISYGGSSVLSTFLLFSVIQGFILLRQREEKKAIAESAREKTSGRNAHDDREGVQTVKKGRRHPDTGKGE